ncbi:MAG TPA: phosphate ABC transporter permease PstA [Candidatus Wallbacteria bacterium]|nr:phosphate ABC transporter permease PstA [Candidatus Wallbacteria bacterium]
MMNARTEEKIAVNVLRFSAFLAIMILLFIIVYVSYKGMGSLTPSFIFENPRDMGREGGIFSAIVSTLYLAVLSTLIATPLGVGTAIYLTEYTGESAVTKIVRFGSDCLAGVPSIIFGLFGFVLFVIYLKLGWCLLSGALTMTFMVLPTIIRTSEEAIKAVPYELREASYSLGATRWQTVTKIVLPEAVPGIITGVILGVGRSISETAAVIFTAGSALATPGSVLESGRTLAVHFYIIAREGISMEKAFATALVLIIFILTINVITYALMNRYISKKKA